MKLQELAKNKIKQVGKIMEGHFNRDINVSKLSMEQAKTLLAKTSNIVAEVQSSINRHTSESNPAYLQALMMKEALEAYVKEGTADSRNPYAGGTGEQRHIAPGAMAPADIKKDDDDEMEEACGSLMADKKKMKEYGKKKTYEAKQINEADVEEAQVTLAAQDVVDRIQKMYEDTAEMQYKDLPNLAQMMKQELGINQTQAYYDATNTAISTLVTALEQAKTDLESAMAPITGEETISPEEFTEPEADVEDNSTPPEMDDEEAVIDAPELDTDLGRERR
jgi:hypothetical protein